FLIFMLLLLPRSNRFTYTTLFRSRTIIETEVHKTAFDRSECPDCFSAGLELRTEQTMQDAYACAAKACRSRRRPGRTKSKSLGKDRKSTRLNSSHEWISYAVFCLK